MEAIVFKKGEVKKEKKKKRPFGAIVDILYR